MPSETEERPRPKLIVIAGPNGAGKTTLTERALAHEWLEGCEYVNPDQIAQDAYGDWNDPQDNRQARQVHREPCTSDSHS